MGEDPPFKSLANDFTLVHSIAMITPRTLGTEEVINLFKCQRYNKISA